jgi:hypothetical protein
VARSNAEDDEEGAEGAGLFYDQDEALAGAAQALAVGEGDVEEVGGRGMCACV